MRVVIAGAGIAGLSAAIAFQRAGHAVTVVERDAAPPPADPDQSFLGWDRPGVPQRRLVHGFLPLARRLLLRNVPDVAGRLFAAGAHDVDLLAPLARRGWEEGDEDLYALRSRRTVFEWVLRTAAEETCAVVAGVPATGVEVRELHGRPWVTGLRAGDRTVAADLVIDATGRTSGLPRWLRAAGAGPVEEDSAPCGLVYYTRFYRRPGPGFPVAASADLGYLRATATAGDGRTFCLTFFVRAEATALRRLRNDAAFEAAVAAIPALGPWREGAEPIGPVASMGGLLNRVRRLISEGRAPLGGLIAVGDSLGHSNPTLGRGMSLALDQAFAAARLPWTERSLEECAIEFLRQAGAVVEASHLDAVEGDRVAAAAYAGGESLDHPRAVLRRAAASFRNDPEIYRAATRQNGLLDPPGSLLSDRWIARARSLLADPRPPAGPTLPEMVALLDRRG